MDKKIKYFFLENCYKFFLSRKLISLKWSYRKERIISTIKLYTIITSSFLVCRYNIIPDWQNARDDEMIDKKRIKK